jgi:hypothetical protein
MSDLLKNKFSNFEVSPPAEAWNNISSELIEHKAFLPLAEKMYNYEVQAPVNAWTNIALLLKTEAKAPVRNIRSMLVKLAAAAVVLGAILVTGLFFMNQEKTQQAIAEKEDKPVNTEKSREEPQTEDQVTPKPAITATLPAVAFPSAPRVRTAVRERFERKRRALEASTVKPDYYDINKSTYNLGMQASLIRNESGDIIQAPAVLRNGSNDEYISVTGPNGQQTRISAKFADVLLYLNKNENLQNEEWQRKFEDWRGKIMQTSFIPSSNNFLDILELKDFILKDNQQ